MVRYEHADALGGQLVHDSLDIDDRKWVNARKWLIEQYKTGLCRQRARYFDAPALAARKRHALALADMRYAQFAEDLLEALEPALLVEVLARLENCHNVVLDAELPENR